MKTILTMAFVAFLAVTTSAVATNVHPSYTQGTTNSCFSYFRAHRQMNGVSMMWAVNQQGISEFKVEFSYDGEFYDEIASIPAHGSAQYKYKHTDVLPGFLYYRVKAIMTDGSVSESQTQKVRIVSRK